MLVGAELLEPLGDVNIARLPHLGWFCFANAIDEDEAKVSVDGLTCSSLLGSRPEGSQ
jgi:hypothetical protein